MTASSDRANLRSRKRISFLICCLGLSQLNMSECICKALSSIPSTLTHINTYIHAYTQIHMHMHICTDIYTLTHTHTSTTTTTNNKKPEVRKRLSEAALRSWDQVIPAATKIVTFSQ